MKHVLTFMFAVFWATQLSAQNAADWVGSYYGGYLAYGDGDSNHENNGANTGGPDIDGALLGVTYGQNYAGGNPNMIWGYEADLGWSGLSGELPVGTYNGFGCGTGPCITNVTWLATLRGRIGFLQGNTLIYGTAGAAVGGLEGTIPGDAALDIGAQTQFGWTAGIGAEFRVSDRMSIKGELLYVDLGTSQYDDGITYAGSPFNVDAEFTQIRIGVNMKF